MARNTAEQMGTRPIPKLLLQQALPASIGILVMSLNILIDTVFVGQWIGSDAIGAINVVLPVSFFIAALGMSIGVGGASIISRALGENNPSKASKTFGNQITLTLVFTILFVLVGLFFIETIIPAFGGKGSLYEPAKIYYTIVMYGVPVLSFCMMANNTIRAEGKPKHAMYAMLLPSISNLLLDYLFINVFDWECLELLGQQPCPISFVPFISSIFFISKKSELRLSLPDFKWDVSLVKEIGSLGFVTLARQAMVSITVLLVNNILFSYGGESSIAVYAIISRMLMFATFPILGITQGFLPIAGYNYGAAQFPRVRQVINVSIRSATAMATVVCIAIYVFSDYIAPIFTKDAQLFAETPTALRWVFAALPIVGIQLIGAAYFQAIGKATPALLLTLTRQGFFFIPLLYILPPIYGVLGVWIAFPIAELLATLVTGFFLNREIRKTLH